MLPLIFQPKTAVRILSKFFLKLNYRTSFTPEAVVLQHLDFAYEVPPGMLKNPDDPLQVLLDFLATYNIERNGIVDLPDAANRPLFV